MQISWNWKLIERKYLTVVTIFHCEIDINVLYFSGFFFFFFFYIYILYSAVTKHGLFFEYWLPIQQISALGPSWMEQERLTANSVQFSTAIQRVDLGRVFVRVTFHLFGASRRKQNSQIQPVVLSNFLLNIFIWASIWFSSAYPEQCTVLKSLSCIKNNSDIFSQYY